MRLGTLVYYLRISSKGLDAARHLYEREGFLLAEEYAGAQWGVSLMEQRFVRERGAVQATGVGAPR